MKIYFERLARLLFAVAAFVTLARSASAQSASVSASSNSVTYGASVTVSGYVAAAPGDSLFNDFIRYVKPDQSTGIIWSTYTDYYYQNSRSVSASIVLDMTGQWTFYAYGYTGDAPSSQQVVQSSGYTISVSSPPIPASAAVSASSTSIAFGDSVTIYESVSATQGDVLFNNYVWYQRPDGSTDVLWGTYADYYWQNSRSSSASIALNQAGAWTFYAYGYTGDAPNTQQVVQSAPVVVNVAPPPAPMITSPLTSYYAQRQPIDYRITSSSYLPTTYSAANLPSGISVDPNSGQMSGRILGFGNFYPVIYATNSTGTSSQTITFAVSAAVVQNYGSLTPGAVQEGQVVHIGREGSTNFTEGWTELSVSVPGANTPVDLGNLPLHSVSDYVPHNGPGTYTFQFRVADAYYNYYDQSLYLVVSPRVDPIPYATSFEASENYVVGGNLLQNGWLVQRGAADVLAGVGISGGAGVRIYGGSQRAEIKKFFSGNQTELFIDLYAKPVAAASADDSTYLDWGSSRVGFVSQGATAAVMIFSGNGSGGGAWNDTGARIPINGVGQGTSWTRFTVRHDYSTHTWDLIVNGVRAASTVPMISDAVVSFTDLTWYGNTSQDAYADQLSVSSTNPFPPPPPPSGLNFSAITDHSATASWAASAGASSYELIFNGAGVGSQPWTSYTINGLYPSTPYSFSVRAWNAAGFVSSWTSSSFTSAPDGTPPSVPMNLNSSAITFNGFTLAWSASSDNVGVTAYEIRQGTTSILTTSALSAPVTGLTDDTTYQFSVRASDARGNYSAWSSPLSVTTALNPLGDKDSDGIPNGVEAYLGTDPRVPTSTTTGGSDVLLNVHTPR